MIFAAIEAMPLYNVYRSTNNAAPELVAVIEADSPGAAIEQALEQETESYPRQKVWAEKA